MLRKWIMTFFVAALAVAGLGRALAQEPTSERWRGVVDLSAVPGAGGELEVFVTFSDSGSEVTATISIPAQGAVDVPLSGVVYTSERLEFALSNGAAFSADRDGDNASGQLTQNGFDMPLTMTRLYDEASTPARPQSPEPPFPYESRDVGYENPTEGNHIAGTLTVPDGPGPHPAVLLITGSGSQDRDETIFGHKPFWVLADHLSRRGIAVLRVDDRGVGGSTGARADLTSEDFAGDVVAGVDFLARQAGIDASRIGLIGHSEGGLIAPMVATRTDAVAFLVLLAGPGVSGAEILLVQNEMLLRAAGAPDSTIQEHLARHSAVYAALAEGASDEELQRRIAALVDAQLGQLPPGQEAVRERAMQTARAQIGSPWLKFFVVTDPADYLQQVQIPVLALNGTLDLQVSADQNLPAIEAALRAAGNPDVTATALDRLNHLFQPATTGAIAEYGQIEQTLAIEALELIGDWVRARTGLD